MNVQAAACAVLALSALCFASCTATSANDEGTENEEADASTSGSGLARALTARFPANGATDACLDPELRLTFDTEVTLGQQGTLRIFDAADDSEPIHVIDIAASSFMKFIAERRFFTQHPLTVQGRDVTIALGAGVLAPAQEYYVTIDSGVFVGADGAALPALAAGAWAFTTRSLPATASRELAVSPDGSADYCSVQGAISAVPRAITEPFVINIGNGIYSEMVLALGQHKLTIRGEDRHETVIAYANNDVLQQGAGTAARPLFQVEQSEDVVIENLTLHNLTPQGGSQAEALRVQAGTRVTVRDVDVLSLQDTLMLGGSVYLENCYIEGNVDYIWGSGSAYFQGCELKTVGRAGYMVQARNLLPTSNGYVFVDSKLTADEGLVGHYLGRIEADLYPDSHVAYIDCQLGEHIAKAGWLLTPASASGENLRFLEYESRDLNGQLLDVSERHPASRQLSAEEAMLMRDKASVLGGWNPTP